MKNRSIILIGVVTLILLFGGVPGQGGEAVGSSDSASELRPGAFLYKVEDGKVSLRAREADLGRVLAGICRGAALGVVIDPEIAGQVTIEYRDLPLREALARLVGDYPVNFDYAYGTSDELIVRILVGKGQPAGDLLLEDQQWVVYLNEEWGFFCEYPRDWKVWTVVTNPGSPDGVIKEKIEFRGPEGLLFWLDVWENSEGRDLTEWFQANIALLISNPGLVSRIPKARIHGRPALVTISQENSPCGSLITMWPEDDLVFNLTYPACEAVDGKLIYDHLLETFEKLSPTGTRSE